MTEIYLITFRENEINPEMYLDYVSTERQIRILGCHNKETAAARLIAELLTRYMAHIRLGIPNRDIRFYYTLHHKPFLRGNNFYFNISHSGPHVVVAVSKGEVGVDIELMDFRKNVLDVAERFFSHEEYKFIKEKKSGERVDTFYRIWSLKESYVKATGNGFYKSLDSFSIIPGNSGVIECIDSEESTSRWTFTQYDYGNSKVALCSQTAPGPEGIIVLDIDTFLNDIKCMGAAV